MNRNARSQSVSHTVRLLSDAATAEAISDALSGADWPLAMAVSQFEAAGGKQEIVAYYDERPDESALSAIIEPLLPPGETAPPLAFGIVEPEDWVAKSQARLFAVRGGMFVVHGSHDRDLYGFNRRSIEIDAGQAFGTAHHGTTRGCLIALSDHMKRRHPRRMLDLGTGSGVLAIAAAKSGRLAVTATDIDPIAIDVARSNAVLNGVAGSIRFLCANGLEHPRFRRGKRFDLITANVLARPLFEMAPAIMRSLAGKGRLILSGLLPHQASSITARYVSLGLSLTRRRIVDGWSTLEMVRGTGRPRRGRQRIVGHPSAHD